MEFITVQKASSNLEFSKSLTLTFNGEKFIGEVLRTNSTTLNTPSIIAFVNGDLNIPESIMYINVEWSNNPAIYISDNQELAKTAENIILFPCFEYENNPRMDDKTWNNVILKYERIISSTKN